MRNCFAILVVAALCGCYTAPGSETQPAADAGGSEVHAHTDVDATDATPQGDAQAEVKLTCTQMGVECGIAPDNTSCGGCAPGKVCAANGKCVTPAAPQPDVQQQPKPSTSCEGRCGKFDYGVACQCDVECSKNSDCCNDYAAKCTTTSPSPQKKKCEAGVKCAIGAGSSTYLWCEEFVGGDYDANGKCTVKAGTKQLFKCDGGNWSCKAAATWATFEQFLCSGNLVNVCKSGELCALSGGKLWCANYSGYLNDSKQCATTSALAEKPCGGTWQATSSTTGSSGYLSVSSFNCKPLEQPAPQPDPVPPSLCKVWRKDVGGSAGWLKLLGGPISGTDVTKGPWNSYALDTNGVATVPFALASDIGLSILPQINASLWAYGQENGGVVIKGSWAVKCPGFEIEISGSPKPCAGGQLPGGVGNWCTHSWGTSDHRIAVRIK